MVMDLLRDYLTALADAKICVIALGHVRYKSIKDKSAIDDGYQMLDTCLSGDYGNFLNGYFDCVMTGVIDRAIETTTITTSGKDREVKKATDFERKLYLRSTEAICAGSRLAGGENVSEYIVFDKQNMAKDFIEVVEDAMKASATNFIPKPQPKPIPKAEEIIGEPEEAEEELKEEVEEAIEDEMFDVEEEIDKEDDDIVDAEANKELMTEIKELFKDATKETKVEIKKVLAENGDTGLNAKAKTKSLRKVLELLQM